MAYTEHSYSNSNNGGSVNSQDSLWQVKANGDGHHGANNGVNNGVGNGVNGVGHVAGVGNGVNPDRSYHYDPMTHGGYGGFEDYSHYPPSDDYLNQRNQRADYAQAGQADPYAAVHKPQGKRMDHLGELPIPASRGPSRWRGLVQRFTCRLSGCGLQKRGVQKRNSRPKCGRTASSGEGLGILSECSLEKHT